MFSGKIRLFQKNSRSLDTVIVRLIMGKADLVIAWSCLFWQFSVCQNVAFKL